MPEVEPISRPAPKSMAIITNCAAQLLMLLFVLLLSPAPSTPPHCASAPSLLSALHAGGADLLTGADLRRGDLLGC